MSEFWAIVPTPELQFNACRKTQAKGSQVEEDGKDLRPCRVAVPSEKVKTLLDPSMDSLLGSSMCSEELLCSC